MSQEVLVERFFETLVSGDRQAARSIVQETLDDNVSPEMLLTDLYWPAHEMIERLYKSDQMEMISYHLATRLLRMLVDQAAARLTVPQVRARTVFATCGPSQGEELAAQMAVDLLEANGFEVTFTGGGIPADEVLEQVQSRQPEILLLFASAASDLPGIRTIIDTLREIGACKRTQVVVGGGVFNRADGLAEEIRADQWAYSPADLVDLLVTSVAEAQETTAQRAPASVAANVASKKRQKRAAA
jgi:methanogenic corrinoid protein MtbC1